MVASSYKLAAVCLGALALFLIAFLVTLAPPDVVAAQKSTPSAARASDKRAEPYQVDVRLEVAPDVAKTRVVQWVETLRALGAAGVSEVGSAPAAQSTEGQQTEPAITAAGPGRIQLRAAIGPAGNLRIGSEIFRPSDRARLETYLKKIRREGVPELDPSAPLWGLGQQQFDVLKGLLKAPANFELHEKPLDSFLDDLRSRTKLSVKLSPDAKRLSGSIRLNVATGRLSLGAALAYVLSQHSLALEPRQSASGELSLLVLTEAESKRPWPVGLTPEQFPGTVAPRLMATARYKTADTPFREVIEAFARELEMDVLVDSASLSHRQIDPDKLRSTVVIPGGTLQSAIRKTLAPLGLKHELRIDEADQPFLWITVGEPTGPPPKGKPSRTGTAVDS